MLLGNISSILCLRKTRFIKGRCSAVCCGGEAARDEDCATTAGFGLSGCPATTVSVAPTRPSGFDSGWYKGAGGESLAGALAWPLEEPLDALGGGEGLNFDVSCRG